MHSVLKPKFWVTSKTISATGIGTWIANIAKAVGPLRSKTQCNYRYSADNIAPINQCFRHRFIVNRGLRWKCYILQHRQTDIESFLSFFLRRHHTYEPRHVSSLTSRCANESNIAAANETALEQRKLSLRPDRGAEYCDERVCACVCLFVCPWSYLRNYTSDLQQIFVHVSYGRGSVLLRRRSDTSYTSRFKDDVIFAHKPRLLDVAAQLKRSAHAALGLAINCAQ